MNICKDCEKESGENCPCVKKAVFDIMTIQRTKDRYKDNEIDFYMRQAKLRSRKMRGDRV